MDGSTLLPLFVRDLNHLRRELATYSDEAQLWQNAGAIRNSAGNLALHLVGNLNHFIGKELGDSGYVRNRPAEFSQRNVPRETILHSIDETIEMLEVVLPRLDAARLARVVTSPVFDQPVPLALWLTHLASHLAYHLGQLTYHRRLVDPTDVRTDT